MNTLVSKSSLDGVVRFAACALSFSLGLLAAPPVAKQSAAKPSKGAGAPPVVIQQKTPVGAPSLVVDEADMLDLGKINSTEHKQFTIHLINKGTKNIQIKQINAPCGCTALAPTLKTLVPGEFLAIPVTFDPHGYYSRTVRQIDFESDDPVRPKFTWRFVADVVSPVIPQPKALSIEVREELAGTQERQFRFVSGGKPIKVKSLGFESYVPPGSPKWVPVVAWKQVDNGDVSGTLTLDRSMLDEPGIALERGKQRRARLVIHTESEWDFMDVHWTLVPVVWASPEKVVFREAVVGQEVMYSAALISQQPFNVKSILSSSPSLKAVQVPSPQKNVILFQVSFKPTEPGVSSAFITVETDNPAFPTARIPVSTHAIPSNPTGGAK